MNDSSRSILLVKVLLTVVSFEFFGPIFRDYAPSHAFNPDWTGHARVHLVWLLGFMFLSGLANVYLIWFRRGPDAGNLWLSVIWQGCNLGGFWISYLLAPSYQGEITVPGIHTHVFGYDENVFVFTILSLVLVVAASLLSSAAAPERATSHALH